MTRMFFCLGRVGIGKIVSDVCPYNNLHRAPTTQGRYQRLQFVENGSATWQEHGVKKNCFSARGTFKLCNVKDIAKCRTNS